MGVFGGKEDAAGEKRERTQCNIEPPPAMGIAEGGVVPVKKSGDSDLVHLVGFGVDDMDAAGHTGVKGMNRS